MENKLKRRKIKHFVFTVLGYLLGMIVNDLYLFKEGISRVLIGILFTVTVRSALDLYENMKYPRLIEKEKQLEKDERLIVIKNKASYTMFYIMLIILVVSWLVSIAKANDILSNFSAILIIVMVSGMEICRYYWSKRI